MKSKSLKVFSLLVATVPGITLANAPATEKHVIEKSSSSGAPSKSGEDVVIPDNFASIPAETNSTPETAEYHTESGISALMLSMWSLSSGQKPAPELLKRAGLDPKEVASFMAGLGPESKLTAADRDVLRKSYTRDSFTARNNARNRYLSFVSKFQDKFPGAASILPELLTVWGEARNIRGFDEADSINQQAKMATVIHVIRNRTEKRNQQFPNAKPYKNKWNIVTRRFQFSAFEPYDPNLAELAMGPASSTAFTEVSALPRNDQVALNNLSKVIASMNRGEILLSKPLVFNNTYHYLTPSLLDYTKENLAKLRSQIARSGKRFSLIQIPGQSPQYLAAVPRWSRQSALISHPPVKIKEVAKPAYQTQIVSPADFIYFRGIK